jgi:SAM-dependent methyltransferase
MDAEQHYDQAYFDHHRSTFEFGGWANVPKFQPFIKPRDTVLDFGCSGGYLLEHIVCDRRLGVELNPVPRAIAAAKGIEVFERTASLPDECADVIISNHVLEHTKNPLMELAQLRTKLKPGGQLVLVVPCEGAGTRYRPNDKDFHLFTWSPLNLGNLLTAADFKVLESREYVHKWPPRIHQPIAQLFGRPGFDLACRLYARLRPTLSQVRAVAAK